MRSVVAVSRRLARERGTRLYLAGGAVRDLLLRRPVVDVDLVVDGDAGAFARELASRLSAGIRAHDRFGTATLELPGGRLDLAATRRETYAAPGALPAVSPGAAIEEDLGRRDFSINAMALELHPRRRLIDPFGGRRDLARGQVRFLHAASPADDPTRALRAVRYGNRLGFRLAPEARRSIGAAIAAGAFDAVSGDRLRRELSLILGEERRAQAVARVHRLGLDGAIHPALARAWKGALGRLACAERAGACSGWLGCLRAWMAASPAGDLERVADRLNLSRADRKALVSPGKAGPVRLAIRGADLIAAGVAPGPAIGRALAGTLAARENGRIGPAQELAHALKLTRRAAGRRR
jgi:tRNA nucleotidyltransferase/poly(A) polymerase